MGAPVGNQFWKVRAKHGRDKIFKTPDALWDAACEYFEWVEANPLYEDKVSFYQGVPTHEPVEKMRAMTIEGLCIFLGVNIRYLSQFEAGLNQDSTEGKGFSTVIANIKQVIRTQKFTGAAADLLNANIIARDLGLRDGHEITGEGGGPVETKDVSMTDVARRMAFVLSAAMQEMKDASDEEG